MACIKYHSMGQVCEFELPETGQILFGRSQLADFELQDAAVSRKHFVIRKNKDEAFVILDLGSHNGTRVNNTVLHNEELVLSNGDEIQLTNYTFHFYSSDGNSEANDSVAMLMAEDVNDIADFDDSTVAFQRPTVEGEAGASPFERTASFSSDDEEWAERIRNYALSKIDDAEQFSISYKELADVCQSFPASGEVVAARLSHKGVLKEVGKELVATGETYPSGAPRKKEVIIWKLL